MKSDSVNKKKRFEVNKNFILVVSIAFVLFGLSFFCWFKAEDSFSESERRVLKSFPKISMEAVMNGKFMKEFED